jgi:hypothetical protein
MKVHTEVKSGTALESAQYALSTAGDRAIQFVKTAEAQATRLAYLPGTIWNTLISKIS